MRKRVRDPNLIREAMATRDLSFRELARLAGCTDGMIRFILAGTTASPKLARAISHALRKRVDDLFVNTLDDDSASSDEQPVDAREAVA